MIGGVVGSFIVITTGVVSYVWHRRKQSHTRGMRDQDEEESAVPNIRVSPFLSRPTYRRQGTSKHRDGIPESSALVSLSSTHDSDGIDERERELDVAEIAELPTLIHRLNNLLSRGRQVEPPPGYEQ